MSKARNFSCLAALGLILLAAGCAAPKLYAPAAYQPAQTRFGAIELPAGKTVYVCPVIDRLSPAARKKLSPDFTPWSYVTEALENELRASGVATRRPGFAFGPGFREWREAVMAKANKEEKAVYLGTELLVLSPARWVMDVQVASPDGELLFEKRGLCALWNTAVDEQKILHMTLRQILADPKFKAALQ